MIPARDRANENVFGDGGSGVIIEATRWDRPDLSIWMESRRRCSTGRTKNGLPAARSLEATNGVLPTNPFEALDRCGKDGDCAGARRFATDRAMTAMEIAHTSVDFELKRTT
jgi:hypothetical protein